MHTQMGRALLLTAAFLTGCSGLQAAPVLSKDGTDTSKQLGERYTWYDGDQPRQVWLDPDLIAEFPDNGKDTAEQLRSVAPQAKELPTPQLGIRLWRVESEAPRALKSLRTAQGTGRFSPVLRDAASPGARMRALPGNVIVYLRPERSAAEAQAWLREQRLELVRKLEFAPNAYLIRSEPGLASLELANRLRESEAVVAAMPEWWQEVSPR